MARVLVIDDDREAREILEEQLRRAGHGVHAAPTGTEGVRMARERRPDVVLLDAELPDMTPAGVCRALEAEMATRGVPVVAMLEIGQDEVVSPTGLHDSIAKPFSVREVLMQIDSALSRSRPQVDPSRPIEFGILRVDRDDQRVWVAGHEVQLTPLEYKLLVTLHDRRDQ